MDRFDRIYRLHVILNYRYISISLKQSMEQLECSKSTADRIFQTLRGYLNIPMEFKWKFNGYIYYNTSPQVNPINCQTYGLAVNDFMGYKFMNQY